MDPRDPESRGGPPATVAGKDAPVVPPQASGERGAVEKSNEPPVVARLMVEIRSDGTTTIARGAMEDGQTGQKVAIVARGTTPLALALSLARSITAAPWFSITAGRAIRALKGR